MKQIIIWKTLLLLTITAVVMLFSGCGMTSAKVHIRMAVCAVYKRLSDPGKRFMMYI